MVWHDSTDGALAAQGLIVESGRGGWRLLRMAPDAGPWPPATPPPVLAEGDAQQTLGKLPPLQPLAAFIGRRRTFRLDEGSTVMLQAGAVSAVAREMPAALLHIRGPRALDLAREIAGDLQLSVPRASLPARAVALARGADPPARRLGAPQISADMSVADAFAQATGWLSDVALHWADHIHPAAGEGPVHQMRVALRRLTTALTVFRAAAPDEPAIAEARAAAKSIAAALGPARDWDVFLATNGTDVATAFPDDKRIAGLLGAATRQRAAAYRALGEYLAGPEFRLASLTLAALPALRPFRQAPMMPEAGAPWDEPVSGFAPLALDRRLKRAAADPATLDDAALHDLRKAAKRLRYAGEIFAPLYPAKQVRSWQKRVTALQSTLGSLNDGTVTPELLEQLGGGHAFACGVVQGFVAARALRTRRKVRKAWVRFSRADPFWR